MAEDFTPPPDSSPAALDRARTAAMLSRIKAEGGRPITGFCTGRSVTFEGKAGGHTAVTCGCGYASRAELHGGDKGPAIVCAGCDRVDLMPKFRSA